jgi:hypothetical protein
MVAIVSGFFEPSAVALDGAGDVFVADPLNNRVAEVSPPSISATPSPLTGSTSTAISAALTGLTPGTKYYFRAVASSAGGTAAGHAIWFTTKPQSATTTALTASAAAPVIGQLDTLTARVAVASPGTGTPTGTVTFYDGTTALGTVGLTAGVATLPYRFATLGAHSITASYAGDLLDQPSASAAATANVGIDTTRTVVAASPGAPVVGQTFTLKATVSVVSPGSGTPTGTVTFYEGTTLLETVAPTGGVATMTLSYPSAGGHLFNAVYSGDTNDKPSASAIAAVTVGPDATRTAVSFSPSPVVVGQPANLIATVSALAPGAGAPTGSVEFLLGTAVLGAVALSGNQAILPWTFTAAGVQAINAVYLGDGNDKISAGFGNLLVSPDATKTTLTSGGSPAVLGQPVTFTATVTPISPGAGVPTGNVVFKDGATVLATVPLSGGVAAFTTTGLTQGNHSITAAYQGDANDRPSASVGLAQRIQSATTVGLSSASSSVAAGTAVTFIATVSDAAPGAGTPTGLVTFYDGSTVIGTVALGAGVARLRLSTLGAGTHSITAVYNGDITHQSSSSSVIAQTIT